METNAQVQTVVPAAEVAAKPGLVQNLKDAPTGVQVLAGAGIVSVIGTLGWAMGRGWKALKTAKAKHDAEQAAKAPAAAPAAQGVVDMPEAPATEAAAAVKKASGK